LDILTRWIQTANSTEDIIQSLKNHLKLTKEQEQLLPEDIKAIFAHLK
jgi:hypothetical protein